MAEPVRIPPPTREPSSIDVMRRLLSETGELLRAEANVVKLELQESTRTMIVGGVRAAVYSGVALLGVLSLLAFVILAVGDWIGGSAAVRPFWVSALIVGLVLAVAGGLMAMRNIKRIGRESGLPRTKKEAHAGREFVREEIQKIKEAAKP